MKKIVTGWVGKMRAYQTHVEYKDGLTWCNRDGKYPQSEVEESNTFNTCDKCHRNWESHVRTSTNGRVMLYKSIDHCGCASTYSGQGVCSKCLYNGAEYQIVWGRGFRAYCYQCLPSKYKEMIEEK